jgi:sodium-dependent phosphate cotransporter
MTAEQVASPGPTRLNPVVRPVPLFCAENFARIAAERKWVIALYLITVFIVLPALVIILVGVL